MFGRTATTQRVASGEVAQVEWGKMTSERKRMTNLLSSIPHRLIATIANKGGPLEQHNRMKCDAPIKEEIQSPLDGAIGDLSLDSQASEKKVKKVFVK